MLALMWGWWIGAVVSFAITGEILKSLAWPLAIASSLATVTTDMLRR